MSRPSRLTLAVATLLSATAFLGVAAADNLEAHGGNEGNIAPGETATVTYDLTASASGGDKLDGCNASPGSPTTVTITAPAEVTVSDTVFELTGCGAENAVAIQFTATQVGNYDITATASGDGKYNNQPAGWILHVREAENETGGSTGNETGGNETGGGDPVDSTPPVLSLPSSTTAEATGSGGATVSWSATATDETDGAVDVLCTPASGSLFPLGTTTVSCSATDAAGNTATGSFSVTISDTTGPILTLPADATVEATGPSGATVTYAASASDLVDGALTIDCAPASGSTFPLGTTTVSCSATDAAGNTASGSFTITVSDTTPPSLTLPADATLEATGPGGAAAIWAASAEDLVDGALDVGCTPASGSTFPLGTTTVSCSATDAAGNTASGSFTVTVVDTTPPALTLPGDATIEATGPSGATATWTASALDIVDGDVAVDCAPASGSTFALGDTPVSCSATDAAGNSASGGFTIRVVDTTPPALSLPDLAPIEATGPGGADATYAATATDIVDLDVTPECAPASGSLFALGNTTVTCSATDDAGNTATGTFIVRVVDTTPPAITGWTGIAEGDSFYFWYGPAAGDLGCSAFDIVSLAVACSISGFSSAVGTHTLTASATDAAGNTGTATLTYTILAWDCTGFYQPVKAGAITHKVGSTIPLKFNCYAGSTEITSTSAVLSFTMNGATTTATGHTALRYSTDGAQFIYNWKTPSTRGIYIISVNLADGSTLSAVASLR